MVKLKFTVYIIFYSTITFGQSVFFGAPQKLSATVNSEGEESMPLLSSDGQTLFFTRFASAENVGGRYAGTDIWTSTREGTRWQRATNKRVPFNSSGNNAAVGTNREGDVLYLIDSSPNKKNKGIYFSRKKNGVWQDAELISIPGIDNVAGHIGFYVSLDFTVILISMQGSDSQGEEDIYVSLKGKSGTWSKPKNLGKTINSSGFEISPFLSPDKKRLYFSSNGKGGEGDADIFYSDRSYESWEVWSAPKNLGKEINSPKFDAYFSMYGDSVCYFSSNRAGNYSDIYRSIVTVDDGKSHQQKIENMMNETQAMLEQLRSSTDAIAANINSSAGSITFDDQATTMEKPSKEYVENLIKYLADNPQMLAVLKYDGKVVNASRTSEQLMQERIRVLKQMFRSGGISIGRLSILSDYMSTEPVHVRLNSFNLTVK